MGNRESVKELILFRSRCQQRAQSRQTGPFLCETSCANLLEAEPAPDAQAPTCGAIYKLHGFHGLI